jgi:hypothetical protein
MSSITPITLYSYERGASAFTAFCSLPRDTH